MKLDLADRAAMKSLFAQHRFPVVIHLAAQAGVRYSLENPHAYVDANLEGFLNVLEGCRHNGCQHLLFASSSSVYGANTKLPFSVQDNVDHPISLYAASKKANELMAHAYSHLYRIPATGLRFFTVYGPWGRPDMAMFIFAKAILEGTPIRLFNHGNMRRDFTYIDDVVEAVVRLIDHPPQAIRRGPATSPIPPPAPRLGRSTTSATTVPKNSCTWSHCSRRSSVARRSRKCCRCSPAMYRQPTPISKTWRATIGFRPATAIEDGIGRFAKWFREYHKI